LEEVPVRKTLSGLAAVGLILSLAACGSSEETGVKANMGATVGIAMPTTDSERWIGDGKAMQEQFTKMGYKVELKYAENVVKDQVAQVNKMVDDGDKLLVISAVDGESLNEVLAKAAKKGVKVIAYDRLLMGTPNVDAQATFDNVKVGVMQGQLMLDQLGLSKNPNSGPFHIEIFAGSSTDANALSFYNGAMSVLKPYFEKGKLIIGSGESKFSKVATKDYSGDLAEQRLSQILSANYKDTRLDAVLSPYDGMSRGIIAALQGAGYGTPNKKISVVSGQDAELASVQLMLKGLQTGTIYKDTRELAKVAVQMGNAMLTGSDPIINDRTSYDNKVKKVPTYLLYPVNVNKDNYKILLVNGGYYKQKQIDTPVAS
jgi:putative multiple sugar transport system substrate-binding protein